MQKQALLLSTLQNPLILPTFKQQTSLTLMKILRISLGTIFAIVAATIGVNLLSEPSNVKVFLGVLLVIAAIGIFVINAISIFKK
jgi:hypothetical protein